LRLLLAVGGGTCAFVFSFGAFTFAVENVLNTGTDPLRRIALESELGLPFAALFALISALAIFQGLNLRRFRQPSG